ncbi:ribbon-helix-helix domain-containing protein [Haloparvum sedimenti]|uniref:ribbon-helix-helix domain-containing protein n=1 Tax=Haloparvum sedimenti TaxID=1678448 RepID=UPI00071E9B6E|nr:ribbon-helix-helix domain-containing protein [Haloparvum sedimenti]
MSADGERVSARMNDPTLTDALDEAAEEFGSRSEALRFAVRVALVDGEDAADDAAGALADLPMKARDGYEELVDYAGVGGRIELGAAESILAQKLNISTESVRHVALRPMRNADVIALHQGINQVTVVVRDADAVAGGEGDGE